MVQIIPAPRTFGADFAEAVGKGLREGREERERKSQLAKENAQIKKEYGVDLSGVTDPKMRAQAFGEIVKQKSKQDLLEENRKLIDEYYGRGRRDQEFKETFGPTERRQMPSFMEKVSQGGEPSQGMPERTEMMPEENVNADASQIPDELITQISLSQPQVAAQMSNAKNRAIKEKTAKDKLRRQTFEAERTYHTQFSKGSEEKANLLRDTIPQQERALNYARNAIESGETGAFTLNHLADLIGADSLKTLKGAQLTLSAKEQLLPSLSRISAKAQNQYMEKRMASMIPQIGQRDDANLTMQEMLEAEPAISKAYLTEFDRLSEQDMKEYGFVKKDIDKRAHEAAKYKEQEIMKRTAYRMREIEERSKGISKMKQKVGKNVIPGTPITLEMMQLYDDKFGDEGLNIAEKNGYYIPTLEEFRLFQARPEEFRQGL